MQTNQVNPFALMVDPAAVFAAVERAERLKHLRRHVCHPLDAPVMVARSLELQAYDARIDRQRGRKNQD